MSNQLTLALLRAGFKQLPQTAGHHVPEPDPKPQWDALTPAQRAAYVEIFTA